MKSIWTACLSLTFAVLLMACDEDETAIPSDVDVTKVWAQMLAPYDIYPLFPVRTLVQPGDVFVLCKRTADVEKPDPHGAIAIASANPGEWVHLFSVDVSGTMNEYAKGRMAYHSFPSPAARSASSPLGSASGASPYSTGAAATKLGFASFPSILSYRLKQSDFGVGAAVGVAALGAGASSASKGTYVLEIPAAEHAHVPHAALREALIANLRQQDRMTLARASEAIGRSDCFDGTLSVVGEAFYARRITVSFGDSFASAMSARAAYQLPTDSTRNAVYQAIGSYATGASAPSSTASSPFKPESNAALAKLMLDVDAVFNAADDASKLGFTGVKMGFAKSKGRGVSMDFEYDAPVAFGVRLYPVLLMKDDSGREVVDLPLRASRTFVGTDGKPLGNSVLLQGAHQPQGAASSAQR